MTAKRVSLLLQFIALAAVADAWILLGSINLPTTPATKKYYWADSTARNWTDSVAFCTAQGAGYAIAEVKTMKNQVDDPLAFLKSKYSDGFTGSHWIGAVTSDPPVSMTWVNIPKSIVQDYAGIDWKPPTYGFCGAYSSEKDTPYFHALHCDLRNKVLCEQIV
ncbi:hypothetical protein Ocin01_17877 [Orchesella cincta]|uniref:C-type lectin domain-containing protein n=1 Tax=Orchesella cincta TaxID=48709 RepID=A0A1D2M7A2_ORCCI|nr:hypothetical protein Ocin01_17877 [Orchesella cincta]